VVARGERVPDRLGYRRVLLVPPGGSEVQRRQQLGPLALEAAPQKVGEEVVVTVPDPVVVQRDDQQVLPLQRLQREPPVVAACEGVAQGAAEAAQDRGLQQERLHRAGLPLQDLFGQKVEDVAVSAGEGPDKAREVLAPPHRERGEVQGRDPTLRDPFQGRNVAG
jgi:hypothetical protein